MNVSSWIFGGNQDESASGSQQNTESTAPSSETLTTEEIRRRRLNKTQVTATSTEKVSNEEIVPSPGVQTSPSKRPKSNTPEEAPSTPQEKKKTKSSSDSVVSSEIMNNSPKTTPSSAKLDRYARALNRVLEYVFQFTVRPDSARDNIKLVDGDCDFLNLDNLDFLLPMRLMEIVQEGPTGPQQGTPCYLIRAYKRLVEKESQFLQDDPMAKDLQR